MKRARTDSEPTLPRFTLQADIRYLDGPLVDLLITNGYTVSFPTRSSAMSAWRWLKALQAGDFTTAAVTGNRYTVVGSPRMTELDTF